MIKKIAVIGGNGYLGHHVAEYFSADKLSRKTGFDVTNSNDIKRLKDYDVIIHMAAAVDKSGENDDLVHKVNAGGTENIAKSLGSDQVFLFASTKEVHNPREDMGAYDLSKLNAEGHVNRYAEKNGFKSGIFRLATTYASHTNGGSFVNYFVDSIKNGKRLKLLAEGKQKRDFLFVDDLSRAFGAFIDSGIQKGCWDVGGGEKNSTTMLGLTEIIGDVVGVNPIVGFSDDHVVGQFSYVTNLNGIEKDLKWKPEIGIAEGIRKISQTSTI